MMMVMMIKSFILFCVVILLSACNSKNQTSNIIQKYELANNKNLNFKNIDSKWIQVNNKNEPCKVYVEVDSQNNHTQKSEYKIFWDGECKNGYANGLGREFEKGILIDNESIVVYENAPIKKPKYFYQKLNLKNIEIKGNFDKGFKTFTSFKNNKEIKRYGLFDNAKNTHLIAYENNDKEFYKKIYPNFNYEIIFDKTKNDYLFYLNNKNSKLKINDTTKRKNLINEIIDAKEMSIKASKKSDLIISQYKNKICKEYISVNFMDDYEYKSICPKLTQSVNTYISKENKKDELDFLLQNSSQEKIKKNSYAIVLGIEDYLLESNVNYSQNSAKMFSRYANKVLGVPNENIWEFINDRETSSGFIKAQWIDFLNIIPKDATVYFYYSGHGVPGNDGNAYILPSDTNAETIVLDKQFRLSNIYKSLNDTKAKRIVAFVDSCFSGKDDNGNLLFGGVAPILRHNPLNIEKSKMTLITAGGANEFSNQYKEKQHRLFSFYLMKGLAKGFTSSEELFKYIRKNVLDKSRKIGYAYKQIPEISGLRNIQIK